MTTAAAIDRLVHHSVILELNMPSYRLEQAQRGHETTTEPGVAESAPTPESEGTNEQSSPPNRRVERGDARREL